MNGLLGVSHCLFRDLVEVLLLHRLPLSPVFCLQAHLNQGPAAALNVLSSCKHLNGIKGCTIDLSTIVLEDFDLWPVFDVSHHEFRNAVLSLRHSNFAAGYDISERLAKLSTASWIHTLNLSYCDGLVDMSVLGGCDFLHTLGVRYCHELV